MTFEERLDQYREAIDGDFVLPVEAQGFLDYMRSEHPAELKSWLETHAVDFVTERLRTRERSERSKAFFRAGSRAFAESADESAEHRRDLFRVAFVVDEGYTRRHLGDMTGSDCRYVADSYTKSAKRELVIAAFMRALAKKTGSKKVSDVMSEETAERLFSSLSDDDPVDLATAAAA